MGAVDFRNTLKSWCHNDRKVCVAVIFQLFIGRTDQEIPDKQVFAGQLIDDAELLGAVRIGSCHSIKNEDFPVLKISGHFAFDLIEGLSADRNVDLSPVNLIMNPFCIHDEFIFWGAARIFTSLNHQGTGITQYALSPSQGDLCQFCRREIAVYCFRMDNSQFL